MLCSHTKDCQSIFPTTEFESDFHSDTPKIFASVIAAAFGGIILVFFVYDLLVERRNNNLVAKAARSNRIVSSLFPGRFRDQIMGDEIPAQRVAGLGRQGGDLVSSLGGSGSKIGSKPLADFFGKLILIFETGVCNTGQ